MPLLVKGDTELTFVPDRCLDDIKKPHQQTDAAKLGRKRLKSVQLRKILQLH